MGDRVSVQFNWYYFRSKGKTNHKGLSLDTVNSLRKIQAQDEKCIAKIGA